MVGTRSRSGRYGKSRPYSRPGSYEAQLRVHARRSNRVRPQVPANDFYHRRLPGAILPDETDNLPLVEGPAHIGQRSLFSEGLADPLELEDATPVVHFPASRRLNRGQ